MAAGPGTTTYLSAQPFELAIQSLRLVLMEADVRLAGELDLCGHVREHLRIGMAPCRVIFVTAAGEALEQIGTNPGVAAQAPLHIVVSARGDHTEFHLLRALPATASLTEPAGLGAFRRLQARVAEAVERIAMRSTFAA